MESDIKTRIDFESFCEKVERSDGYRRPLAFGVGIAHVSEAGNILDTFFPFPNLLSNFSTVAVLADTVNHLSGTATYRLDSDSISIILSLFAPFIDDGEPHGNIDAIKALSRICDGFNEKHGGKALVVSFIDVPEYDLGPQTISDAYLRLHLLSHCLVEPNSINLVDIFDKLPNNIWTNEGPIAPEDLPRRRFDAMMRRHPIHVNAVDKFPRMVDYVVPPNVRIADASRVRLGAFIGSGTTVMHEGFINFNAGTLGTSMVEGRISAGVVVGDQSDLGGSASTMGTLSGGGTEIISVGRGCLIGANAGIGISLGDRCVIEAGLYVTAGMPVHYRGSVVKALTLSGNDELTFRRNGATGEVEVLDRPNSVELNEDLHRN